MATAEDIGRYVIQDKADTLLSEVSNDFAALMLQIASRVSSEKTAAGVPVITVCNVATASGFLCSIIDKGLKSGEIPPEGAEALANLKLFCEKVNSECAKDANAVADAHGQGPATCCGNQ